MKSGHKILAVMLTLLLLLSSAAQAQPLFTDAGLAWGMSREQVLAKVKPFGPTEETVSRDGSRLLVVRNLAFCGFSMDAWCRFEGEALESVTYLLPAGFTLDGEKQRQSLALFDQRISAVYGQPASREENSLAWNTASFALTAAIGDYSNLNGRDGSQIGVRFAAAGGPAAATAPGGTASAPASAPAPAASASGQAAAPQGDGSVLMTVVASESMDYDHTAGERWNRSFVLNNEKFFGETTVRVRAGDTLSLGATVTDSDSHPDTGAASVAHTVTERDLTEGFTEVFKVQITENEGSLAGKDARFSITFRFITPDGKSAPAGGNQVTVSVPAPASAPEKETVRADGAVLMTVRAVETMLYDHTAGDRWNRSFMAGSEKFYGETQIYVKAGETLTLAATVTDSDNRPDSATGSVDHTVTEADLTDGFTEEFKVRVTENEGALAGREAMFRITFTFASPSGKIAPAKSEAKEAGVTAAPAAPAETQRPAVREDGAVLFRVHAQEDLEKNAGVGEKWNRSFTLNGEKFYGDTTVYLKPGDTLYLSATVTESDAHPDRGTEEKEHLITEADLTAGFTESFKVTVTENEGDNEGRKAVWNITFTFAR